MRTTLLAITTTLLLSLGLLAPPGASAAVNSYVVSGHPITKAPGMRLVADKCTSGTLSPTVTPLTSQEKTVGNGSLGWKVNQLDYEAGPAATIAGDPATINAARIDVYAPTGTSGHAYAYFPFTANEYYVGFRYFTVPAGQWIENDLTNVGYYWDRYVNGSWVSRTSSTYTIQSYASAAGATSAEIGVLLGCGGEEFYVDDMYVANASNAVSYDFEPAPAPTTDTHTGTHTGTTTHTETMAHLEWSTNGKDVQTSDQLAIAYGQSIWLLGHSHQHTEAGYQWFSGIGSMYAQPTRGAAGSLGRKGFDPTHYAAFKVSPKQETVYSFTTDASGAVPSTTSNPVKVLVTSKVRAAVVDKSLVQGQRLAVGGRIWPSKAGVKITLQRRVGSKWKKLETVKTRKRGKFTVATKADSAGTWVVRVVVASTNTNLGTSTRSAKVTVKRPPRRNAPPPPPATDNTPEVTTSVTTPTPTQVSSTPPKPDPVRPTNTGRSQTPQVAGTTSAVPGAKSGAPSKDQ